MNVLRGLVIAIFLVLSGNSLALGLERGVDCALLVGGFGSQFVAVQRSALTAKRIGMLWPAANPDARKIILAQVSRPQLEEAVAELDRDDDKRCHRSRGTVAVRSSADNSSLNQLGQIGGILIDGVTLLATPPACFVKVARRIAFRRLKVHFIRKVFNSVGQALVAQLNRPDFREDPNFIVPFDIRNFYLSLDQNEPAMLVLTTMSFDTILKGLKDGENIYEPNYRLDFRYKKLDSVPLTDRALAEESRHLPRPIVIDAKEDPIRYLNGLLRAASEQEARKRQPQYTPPPPPLMFPLGGTAAFYNSYFILSDYHRFH
jgi:hypothetical protein